MSNFDPKLTLAHRNAFKLTQHGSLPDRIETLRSVLAQHGEEFINGKRVRMAVQRND